MKHLFDQRINVSAQQIKVLSKQNTGKKISKMNCCNHISIVTEKQLPSFETEIIQTVPELVKAVIKGRIRTKRILKIKTPWCWPKYKFWRNPDKEILVHVMLNLRVDTSSWGLSLRADLPPSPSWSNSQSPGTNQLFSNSEQYWSKKITEIHKLILMT